MFARLTVGTSCFTIGLAIVLAISAPASSQNLDLGITDDASYAAAIEAISAAEFVRYDYRTNPSPRIAGVVAALLEFATRNPLADEAHLTLFVQTFGAALMSAAPGDPQLRRSANFLPALRYKLPLTGVEALRGLNTDIGAGTAALLGIDVPDPLDFSSLQNRIVGFEAARGRRFANSVEFSNLLVVGLLGRDTNGNDRPAVAAALRTFLESEGYEPVPDGVDDERFAPVYAGLAQLPADYTAYMGAITVPPGESVPPIWSGMTAEFNAVAAGADAQLVELADADLNGPTLLEGVALGSGPEVLDMLRAELVARLDQVAAPRTLLAADALLLLQNQDPEIRSLAFYTQQAASIQGDGYDWLAIGIGSVKVLGGAVAVGAGIATIVAAPATFGAAGIVGMFMIAGGVFVIAEGGLQIAQALQDGGAPSNAEVQIFNQIVAVREDIENMRVQMHERFDRIEMQLNFVFEGMANGFNAIGNQIGDLQESVDDLRRDVLINRAALERIEDALYGMAQDLLDADLALWCNTYLNYRGANGIDLPYAGSGGDQSFLEGANEFFTVAVDIAQNQSLAGPTVSMLSVASADEMLSGESIGRNVNDLRVFPFNHLGLPRLSLSRIVAPAPWAQGAAAYVRFARLNPWYFAYQHEQQLLAGGVTPDVDRIIQEGQRLASTMAAGRNQALFDALFQGYSSEVENLRRAINIEALVPLGVSSADGITSIDPWGPTAQNVQAIAPAIGPLSLLPGGPPLSPPNSPSTSYWGLFRSNEPETAELLRHSLGEGPGTIIASAFFSKPQSPLIQLQFAYRSNSGEPGPLRSLVLDLGINEIEADEFVASSWACSDSFRNGLLASLGVGGSQHVTCAFPYLFDVTFDDSNDLEWAPQADVVATDGVAGDSFGDAVAISGDTLVVGAPNHDIAGLDMAGSAYIFTRSGTTWTQQAMLTISAPQQSARFGYSVAIDGDTVVVGAPFYDLAGGRFDAGSAFVFTRSGTNWTQQARLDHQSPTTSDLFGFSVAIDGDRVLVGAAFDDVGGFNRGSAFAFVRSGTSWAQQGAKISALDGAAQDQFGWSVSIAGDYATVGAPFDSFGGASMAGSAYVYFWNGSAWVQQQKLIAPNVFPEQHLGGAVAISGDRVLVGRLPAEGVASAGAAYVWLRTGAQWALQSELQPADGGGPADGFGTTVSIWGDRAFVQRQNPRSAYAFEWNGTAWVPTQRILESNQNGSGYPVAVSGDDAVLGASTSGGGGDKVRILRLAPGGSSLAPFITQELEALQPIVLNAIITKLQVPGSNLIKDAADALSDWDALIRAYATFSLPFALETSNVLRAALEGSPVTGDLCLHGDSILSVCQRMLAGEIPQNSVFGTMLERSAIAQQEINDAIASPVQGHAYLNWMLAELRHLRDHAFDLARDDTYAAMPNMTFLVNAANGLMMNDVKQQCRTTLVDTAFVSDMSYVAPENGIVMVNSDGSFTYNPNPGFSGTDHFTYRTGTFVAGIGCQPGAPLRGELDQFVYSNPASVVILVASAAPPPPCPGDANGDGMIAFSDITSVLENWGFVYPGSTGPGDADHNSTVNFSDITKVLENWGVTCP